MKYGFRYVKGTEVEEEIYDNLSSAVSRLMLTWAKLTDEEREAIKMAEGTLCCTVYEEDIPKVILNGFDLRQPEEGRACLIMDDDDSDIQTMYFPDNYAYLDAVHGYTQDGRIIHSFGDVTLILHPDPESAVKPTEDEIRAMGRAALTDKSE